MTNTNFQTEHAWFREQIAAALTDGLSGGDRARFDAHAAECETCSAELRDAQAQDRELSEMFESAQPRAGLEDRLIQGLRQERSRRFIIPSAVQRTITGVAAAVMLAGSGYVVTQTLESRQSSNRTALHTPAEPSYTLHVSPTTSPAAPAMASPEEAAERAQKKLDVEFHLNKETGADYVASGYATVKDLDGDGIADKRRSDLYANGHVTWESNPFGGVNRDVVNKKLTERFAGGTIASVGGTISGSGVSGGDEANGHGAGVVVNGGTSYYFGDFSTATASATGKAVEGERRIAQRFEPAKIGLGTLVVNGSRVLDEAKKAEETPKKAAAPTDAYHVLVAANDAKQPSAPAPAPAHPAAPGLQVADNDRLAPATTRPAMDRKIIRNGTMEFEVDRFDSAFAQVANLVREAGGFIGSTDSEKLPNGKVKGTVTVRVPPDKMDVLVLQLRGIGELKSQKLGADDVSKQYTDLESGLRAARAMEERLLDIIKTGKGQIKDLLAAEKELGEWRTRIETMIGQMRYYDNLVSMATLNITLYEKDIKTPATAVESETIDAGVETEDVEKSRTEALKAIEAAKGRVIQSDMKRFDAGQFAATIVAEVSPDNAGPLLDRIRQLGKVARLDVQRKQTTDPNATGPSVRVEKKETRFNLSIYNLANVAPRQTTNMNLAADDIEAAYQAILNRVAKVGGRVITSNLNRQKPEQTTGTISFEVPSAEADAIAAELRAAGEVMKLTVTENPDTNNVTTAKKGFVVQLFSAAGVAPRETTTLQIAAANVADARQKILAAAAAGAARVLSSQMNENDRQNVNAALDIEVRRDHLPAVEKALAEAGDTVNRSVTKSSDTDSTIDSKVRLQIALASADRLAPRQNTTLFVELSDVERAMGELQSAAADAGGRTTESNLSKQRDGKTLGKVVVEVPLGKAEEIVSRAKSAGVVRVAEAQTNAQVPAGKLARARIDVTFGTSDTLVEADQGFGAAIRAGLSTSIQALLISLKLIIIGLLAVCPWAAIIFIAWKLIKRRSKPAAA